MRIAVLSGKGGTGKTFVSVNLALAFQNATYVDCDVEEPNGKLFFKPTNFIEHKVYTAQPFFDLNKCDGCRKCVDFCQFNALVFINNKPRIFSELCHDCGGCIHVCTKNAITEQDHFVGVVEKARYKNLDIITGVLNVGEASSVPVIKSALSNCDSKGDITIIDSPPGSSCGVIESVISSDCCILVAEPTAFGFHNFKMVYKLVKLLGKKTFVIVNKEECPYEPMEEFFKQNDLTVILKIPYSKSLAKIIAEGRLAYEEDENCKHWFDGLSTTLRKEVM